MSSRARKIPAAGRTAAAKKRTAKKTAGARKAPAARKAMRAPPAAVRKRADQMTLAERTSTENWFNDTHADMTATEAALDLEILLAPSGSMKDALNRMKGKLLHSRAELDRRVEAFFAEGSTETKRLAKELREQIAKQKAAEAVVKLLDDFADLVAKISA